MKHAHVSQHSPSAPVGAKHPLIVLLNREWHERAMQFFTVIVLFHWAEHLAQAFQVYALGWTVKEARGVLGMPFPWLISSEILHYGYAFVMLVGLWLLRPGFVGRGRTWWTIALGIQFWHHIEHALLQGQAIIGRNLFDAPIPMSVAQFFIRRVELHLIYNTIVFIPMLVAMYYHMFPPQEEAHAACTCAVRPRLVRA